MKAVLSQETARRCKNHNTYQMLLHKVYFGKNRPVVLTQFSVHFRVSVIVVHAQHLHFSINCAKPYRKLLVPRFLTLHYF